MTIQIGERVPDAALFESTEFGDACPLPPQKVAVGEAAKGKRVVVFGLPGAYTPTCSGKHLPGYVEKLDEFRRRGYKVACIAVNDAFVMKAWAKDQNVPDDVMMLADGNGAFAKALGLEMDASAFGMGLRGKRFALVADDGVVKQLHVEAPGEFKVSSAEHVLAQLQ